MLQLFIVRNYSPCI